MPMASLQHLGDRREAVGGAGGVGDDEVVLRQLVVVDAVDDRQVGAVGRSRDDDALGAGREVGGGLVARGEDAGALEGDVDAEVLVRQLGRDRARGDLDRPRPTSIVSPSTVTSCGKRPCTLS